MINSDMMRHVLLLGIEDFSGLWEVIWEFHTRYPDLGEEAANASALEAVMALLGRGYVRLHRCREPYGEMLEIAAEEQRALIVNPANWEPPASGTLSIRFETTPAGEVAYRTLESLT